MSCLEDLTILCVTEYGPHSEPFLCAMDALADRLECDFVQHDGRGAGCIENILDDAVAGCVSGYILRLDDDEKPSPGMERWLASGAYRESDHWAFPRAHLYPSACSYITSGELWPDLQTRLSVKERSGGRYQVHAGSPHGTGRRAPCVLEHHKFLCRGVAERTDLVGRYERMGAGAHHRVFSLPEEADVTVAPYLP